MNYAEIAPLYQAKGWSDILPIDAGTKGPPPAGYTGHNGTNVTATDRADWSDHEGNYAIRVPRDVLGIDVDQYQGKHGAQTLKNFSDTNGPLPTAPRSSAREGESGIYWYKVPAGLKWPGILGPDVELIQYGHRYAMVWPSIHPGTGTSYQWTDETIPATDGLPTLPAAWVDALTGGELQGEIAKGDADPILDALRANVGEPPCFAMHRKLAAGLTEMQNGSRHDTARDYTIALMRLGESGHKGAAGALAILRQSFLSEIADRETGQAAISEWRRLAEGAAERIAGDPTPEAEKRCCDAGTTLHDYQDLIADAEPLTPEVLSAMDLAVRHKATDMEVTRRAREISVEAEAAERLKSADLPKFMSLPALVEATGGASRNWRFERAQEVGTRVLLEASAKSGKTTLLANAVNSALSGESFLGAYQSTPLADDEHVLIIDTELGPTTQARWLDESIRPDLKHRALVWSIAGKTGALDVTSASGREGIAKALEGLPKVGLLIVDVAGAWLAPLRLDENSNTDVRRFCDGIAQLARDITTKGEVILSHHAGYATGKTRSRGASAWRDWPDAVWTISRNPVNEERHFEAFGRDIEIPVQKLVYWPESRKLTLAPPEHFVTPGSISQRARDAQ